MKNALRFARALFPAHILGRRYPQVITQRGSVEQQPPQVITQRGSVEQQHGLSMQYRLLMHSGAPAPSFDEIGFSIYSESNEDGILHFIFALIGAEERALVDIGAGGIEGSNTANLIINHGWHGILIDGSQQNALALKEFYQSARATRIYPPTVLNEMITSENVNEILTSNGVTGEIGLLSIDIDGVDYWIWKAIECVSPRVVLIEYQCIWGPYESVTVPYSPDFQPGFSGPFGIYSGASLAALVKLGEAKGYRLVGCQRYGYNAFFVRNDIECDWLPRVDTEQCFRHPFVRWAQQEFLEEIRDLPWDRV